LNPQHLHILACPICGSGLTLTDALQEGDRIKSGTLTDHQGHSFRIVDFIPRFVSPDNYASNFSAQWEHWPELLSQYDGYKVRFEKETKWGSELTGAFILEAGCGAGTFTEFAAATGATILSFDLSAGGVSANYARNGHLPNVLIVQADIYNIPAQSDFFDYAFCFGVLQHTPRPKEAFMEVCRRLIKGTGKIATDIYTMPPLKHPYEPLWKNKYRMRKLVGWMTEESIRKFVCCYVNLLWPLTRVILKVFPKKGIFINRFFLFDDYPPRLPGMNPDNYKSFAMLDINDFLAPKYDFPVEEDEFISWHAEAGLTNIDVHPGYNGLEGRGIRSSESLRDGQNNSLKKEGLRWV